MAPFFTNFVRVEKTIVLFKNEDPWREIFTTKGPHGAWIGSFNSDATATMQFRQYEGAPDPAILTLGATGDSRVWLDGYSAFVIIAHADLATLPTCPAGGEPGTPTVLRYDILVNTPGLGENVAFYGAAIVRDGVSR